MIIQIDAKSSKEWQAEVKKHKMEDYGFESKRWQRNFFLQISV